MSSIKRKLRKIVYPRGPSHPVLDPSQLWGGIFCGIETFWPMYTVSTPTECAQAAGPHNQSRLQNAGARPASVLLGQVLP